VDIIDAGLFEKIELCIKLNAKVFYLRHNVSKTENNLYTLLIDACVAEVIKCNCKKASSTEASA
jgi:hypothetical protein